jgi:hypothetical protein
MGAESFRADGQTDMMKLNVAFRNFEDSPKSLGHPVSKTGPT